MSPRIDYKTRCRHCRYWDRQNQSRHAADDRGYCHRFPPTPVVAEDGTIIPALPFLWAWEYCGEHSARTMGDNP